MSNSNWADRNLPTPPTAAQDWVAFERAQHDRTAANIAANGARRHEGNTLVVPPVRYQDAVREIDNPLQAALDDLRYVVVNDYGDVLTKPLPHITAEHFVETNSSPYKPQRLHIRLWGRAADHILKHCGDDVPHKAHRWQDDGDYDRHTCDGRSPYDR